MGYRLWCKNADATKLHFYGTKLYGYVDEKKLESYKYLIRIHKFTGDELFFDTQDNTICLNTEQFREFIRLYGLDLKEFYDFPIEKHAQYAVLKQILETESNKIVKWL